ncbi:DUF3853 family protein [Elizabethkingia anophelis]|uniref:DUF3853 family protein n=1 Tax=Elizabethkingia anophelis TaxID=1117645 RepID=UPI003787057E
MNNQSKISEGLGKIRDIDPNAPFLHITVGEFLELQNKKNAEKRYEYGLKGIAKIFGCSVSQANRIKRSGIINEAIIQNGNIIIIETEKALQLFGQKEKNDKK